MRRGSAAIIIMLCMLAIITCSMPLCRAYATQPEAPQVTPPAPPKEKSLEELREELQDALLTNNWNEIHVLAPKLKNRLQRRNIGASDELSELYMRTAKRASSAGAKAQAETLIEDARVFSPDNPAPYFMSASRSLTGLSVGKAFNETEKGFAAMERGVRQGLQGLAFIAAGVGVLFLTTAIIFASLLAFRYLPLFAHDLEHKVPALAGKSALLVTFALLMVPTIFGGGLLLFPLTAMLLFWMFMSKKERVVAGVMIVLMLLTPLLSLYLARVHAALASPIVKAVVELRKGPLDGNTESELRRRLETDKTNKEVLLALALHERKLDRKDEALRIYGMIEESGKASSIVYNNMANILVEQGDPDKAMAYYGKAIAANNKDAMPHLNLSQVLRDRFAFDEAKKEFAAADALDPDLIRYYRDSTQGESGFVMDKGLDPADIWKVALTRKTEGTGVAEKTGAILFIVWPPYGVAILALIAAGLAVVLEKKRAETGHAFYCGHCGVVSCRHCTKGKLRSSFCSQCLQAFVRRDGVAAKSRMQKIIEITKYRQQKLQVGRWLAMAIPGAGHMALGYTVSGIFWMVVGLVSVLFAAAVGGIFGISAVFLVALAPFVLFHALSVYSCSRIRKAR